MSTVYRYILGTMVTADGVAIHLAQGMPISVQDQLCVRLTTGSILDSNGFSASEEGAALDAVGEIERMASILQHQADRMRAKVTGEEPCRREDGFQIRYGDNIGTGVVECAERIVTSLEYVIEKEMLRSERKIIDDCVLCGRLLLDWSRQNDPARFISRTFRRSRPATR